MENQHPGVELRGILLINVTVDIYGHIMPGVNKGIEDRLDNEKQETLSTNDNLEY